MRFFIERAAEWHLDGVWRGLDNDAWLAIGPVIVGFERDAGAKLSFDWSWTNGRGVTARRLRTWDTRRSCSGHFTSCWSGEPTS